MSKKPYEELRWRKWPKTGIKTGGKPKKEVSEVGKKWLQELENKSKNKQENR